MSGLLGTWAKHFRPTSGEETSKGLIVEEPDSEVQDDVYPVHYLDDTMINRSMIMCWTMRFDEVLNPEALRCSLSRVLEIGDWRKLGGRLRLNNKRKLEIHVPKVFTDERPALRYSHESFDIGIQEHPLASQLPKATGSPSLHPGPETFTSLAQGPGSPVSIREYIRNDEPQLALHIVSFEDATLVSLSWPHTLMDAMGRYSLVQAWCHILAGRESEVAPLLGAREDVTTALFTDAEGEEEEPYALANQVMGPWQMLLFVFYFLVDILWTSRVLRTILLPKKAVLTLIQEARNDVSDVRVGDAPAFVSEGDVLTAWATRMAALELPPNSARPVFISTVFELRSRLRDIFQTGGAYIQNLVLAATTIVPAQEVVNNALGLGGVALRIRQAIGEQTREPQIKAQVRLIRHSYEKRGHGPGFGRANNFIVVFSNWIKGNFYNVVDFSPAVVPSPNQESGRLGTGKPVYFHCQTLQKMPTSSNIFNILGKDQLGNVWITGYLPSATWAKVQVELNRLS
ncbi:hypothetical protein jhhlp_001737 [Lomentospora prolificans]|uniref:Uncharacterized protein n=1 Tax=Lomentospora prolificans TaxID=41688 RepID=A0A2N3NH43_9PEZI|nr:hypothetical protein jhhlp_001737 [Lomentospora prolificans]